MTTPDAARSAQPAPATGPLRGVRVVEFAGIGPGPFACMMLADMGADVVRLDRPGGRRIDATDFIDRGRRTVHIDLKSDAGREQALALISRADLLVEGFRPGVMERLGLGPEAALGRNPRLVYGRMTGWGQSGPLAHTAGHDIDYIALTGALAAIGPAGKPVPPLNLVGDYGGGALYLVVGLLAGLLEARASGKGQVVDAAMCDGASSLMTTFFAMAAKGRWTERREDNILDGAAPFYGTYECADGRFLAVGSIEPQFYATLRGLMGLTDADFDAQHDRSKWPLLREKLARVIRTRTRDEWTALCEETDACVAPVLTLSEAPSHRHLAGRQTFVTHAGQVQPAPAPRFSRTPSAIQQRPMGATESVDGVLANWP
jgi:alpha-methylacyl-CoA racemase